MNEFEIKVMQNAIDTIAFLCKKTENCENCPFAKIVDNDGFESVECLVSFRKSIDSLPTFPYEWNDLIRKNAE